jgi:hypothetical protein
MIPPGVLASHSENQVPDLLADRACRQARSVSCTSTFLLTNSLCQRGASWADHERRPSGPRSLLLIAAMSSRIAAPKTRAVRMALHDHRLMAKDC